jgi:23S rRNA G2445 N2-methylase RlmL
MDLTTSCDCLLRAPVPWQVVGLDSSAAVVQLAQQNAELNGVAERCNFVKADVADFLKQVGILGVRDGGGRRTPEQE